MKTSSSTPGIGSFRAARLFLGAAEPLCHSRVSMDNNQNFIWAMSGLARGLEPPLTPGIPASSFLHMHTEINQKLKWGRSGNKVIKHSPPLTDMIEKFQENHHLPSLLPPATRPSTWCSSTHLPAGLQMSILEDTRPSDTASSSCGLP